MKPCRHCTTSAATRPRGLCRRCYHDTAVRFRYAPSCEPRREPTESELAAMIAEQSATMPVAPMFAPHVPNVKPQAKSKLVRRFPQR